MNKYLFEENGFVYELDNNEFYNPIDYIPPHNLPPYASVKFEYMKEHQPEYILKLLDEGRLFEVLESYEKEQIINENRIYEKSEIQDSMTRMMAREWLMYQELT